ncbi:hypothetical protein [Desulfobacter sp.]|uniref:hypothetical protein n=1 Tax=Desulfobacter sp. TaxID=2294 RepID=UPI003D0D835C
MRITDPQVILNGEKDLIASVQKDLDLDAVRDLLKERLTVRALSPKGGRIVVHDNDVAFRLDYEINLDGSLLFDRNGNLLEDSESMVQASDLDDHLSINLPDYDDAPNEASGEDLSDDIRDAEPGLEIENLEDESVFDQDGSDLLEADDSDELIDDLTQADDIEDLSAGELPDIDLEDGYTETGQDMLDDDISDILQESRDFWEKKKE